MYSYSTLLRTHQLLLYSIGHGKMRDLAAPNSGRCAIPFIGVSQLRMQIILCLIEIFNIHHRLIDKVVGRLSYLRRLNTSLVPRTPRLVPSSRAQGGLGQSISISKLLLEGVGVVGLSSKIPLDDLL